MKTLALLILALCSLFTSAVSAATLTLAWDANAASEGVVKYTVYEQTSATVWAKVVDVVNPTATLSNVSPATHTYGVTASTTFLESLRSNSVTINAVAPSVPANMRVITVTVTDAAPTSTPTKQVAR